MKALLTALAILAAVLLDAALSRISPLAGRVFDPFLLITVYCGLQGGEVHGMLAGAAAGWVQDVNFGGTVVGLSGLTKVVVGFGVGVAGARFLLSGPLGRASVVFAACLVDSLLLQGVASAFEVRTYELPLAALLGRSAVNAVVGAAIFEALDRRLPRRVRL
jgi:rod shape-determining protein MreD